MARKKDKNKARDSAGPFALDYWQDPRSLIAFRDEAKFQRLRDLVDKEILHQAWGCKLWNSRAHGKRTRDQREAGDLYCTLVENRDRGES